tara:strand:+ start:527 stop:892 length:366 start_codon:yes stop_codon:yes gene_type:complete
MSKFENLKILIIDDDQAIAELTSMLLEDLKAKPKVSFTPEEALELLKEENYDLILSDFRFKDYNAITFLQKLEKQTSNPPQTVIITGLNPSKEEHDDLFKYSCLGVLEKPLEINELEDLIT